MKVAEVLEILDQKVLQLKVEYEQYFMKVIKREPTKLRGDVDRVIRTLSTRQITNTALKFKYNSIVSKYNSYKQYWNRVLRKIDEGTYSRKSEAYSPAERARAAGEAEATSTRSPRPRSEGLAPAGGDRLRDMYQKYLDAKSKCKEPVKGISYESFTKTVEKSTKKAKDIYKTKDVELKVYIKDGKAKLAITPKE